MFPQFPCSRDLGPSAAHIVQGFEELCRCMQKMNAELGIGSFTERHVQHYMHRFDTDGDKFLNQDECLAMFRPMWTLSTNGL